MGLYCIVVTRSIEMSQKVINLSLQLFVFLAIFLVDVGSSGSFNITRHTTGDVFDNTNSSKSCNESGASCVFDGENSPFCGVNCCSCICPITTHCLANQFAQRKSQKNRSTRICQISHVSEHQQDVLVLR